MFKFRQPLICSDPDLDIVSDSDSVSDVAEEIQKGVSINSVSEPRTSLESSDENKTKLNNIGDCDSGLTGSERIETDRDCCRNNEGNSCSGSSSCQVDGTTLDKKRENGSGPSATAIMCDRKRKERHESCSQGQEKKVIRSLSHPKVEAGGDKLTNDFRRTQSNDSFQPNKSASPPPTGDIQDENGHGLLVELVKQNNMGRSGMQVVANGHVDGQTNQVDNTSSVDSSSYGVGSAPNPQYGIVKCMPIHFEAELQRQWERSAQWSSNGGRKAHSGRKHKSRSKSSELSGSSTQNKLSVEEKTENEPDLDDLVGENVIDDKEDLSSPTSDESSSSSIESLEDMENNGQLSPSSSCEEIETDVVEDSGGNRNHPSLGNSNLEPLPHLDFSTLHHQVETHEPISFLAALHSSGIEDQVMLSPRNSILIKDVIDPNLPPSPPLYQAPLDPPISRQHGGNQNMKMNQLSRQISNLKKHLKALEEEHEQLFGYKPSHADKLNHKEMRKCLLHLTKAKREMKQMREDPANVRVGGNLLQLNAMNAGQISYSRNSAEALKSLDETVREITKTLSDKRRMACRPEDPAMMSSVEINQEKGEMQKQLLMLEKKHGRPGSKEEKDVVRTLYERYRSLKKSGSRLGNIKENSIDLAPILEYEPLEFNQNEEGNPASIVELRRDSLPGVGSSNSPKGRRRRIVQSGDDGDDGDCSILFGNEGFTEMSLVELEASQKSAREEKRRLRVMLRKFEYDFQNIPRHEKHSSVEMESIYQKYKRRRATVRLLDVLITKQRAIESG